MSSSLNKNDVWIRFYQDGVLEREVTFAEAEAGIEVWSKTLTGYNLSKSDRVLVKMNNSVNAAIVYLTLRTIGVVAIPINPLDSQEREDYIKNDASPRLLINNDGDIEILNSEEKPVILSKRIQTIIYTSGTTGRPKGVCLTRENWDANAQSLAHHHDLNSKTILATSLPLFHCNAHGLALITTYSTRSRLVLFNKTPVNFLEILEVEKVQIVSLVPAILHKLFYENRNWKPYPELRYFLTAAAPLTADLYAKVHSLWGVRLVQGYGLSESTNFSCTMPVNLSNEMLETIMFPQPSIGVALPGVHIGINVEKEGVPGELVIQSDSNTPGYWGTELAGTEKVHTGDIGYFKKFAGRKFYYLQGRTKELINRGGEKFSPLEIERELCTVGLSEHLHVFGIPDQKLGEEIVAVTVDSDLELEKLEFIPYFRRPKMVFRIDLLPTTATGKLQRSKLPSLCKDLTPIWVDSRFS